MVKKIDFTEEELLDLLSQQIGNPMEAHVETDDHLRIIEEMSKIEGVQEFFRALQGTDMRLYWLGKTDKERDIVRGHFNALAWLRKQMKNIEKVKELEQKRKSVA